MARRPRARLYSTPWQEAWTRSCDHLWCAYHHIWRTHGRWHRQCRTTSIHLPRGPAHRAVSYGAPLHHSLAHISSLCDLSVTILSLIMQALRESGQRSVATLNQPLQNLSPWLSMLSARQAGQTDVVSVVEPPKIEVERIVIKLINLLDREFSPGSVLVKEVLSFTCGSRRSLLHLSAMLGSHELLQKIIDHGADLNQRDMCGCTALHYAALYGHIAAVNMLVSGGANVEIADQWGRLARELASDSGHRDIADRLKAWQSKTSANVVVSDIEDSSSREQVTETRKSPQQQLYPSTSLQLEQDAATHPSMWIGASTDAPSSSSAVVVEPTPTTPSALGLAPASLTSGGEGAVRLNPAKTSPDEHRAAWGRGIPNHLNILHNIIAPRFGLRVEWVSCSRSKHSKSLITPISWTIRTSTIASTKRGGHAGGLFFIVCSLSMMPLNFPKC